MLVIDREKLSKKPFLKWEKNLKKGYVPFTHYLC